jgi:hypothetical protein
LIAASVPMFFFSPGTVGIIGSTEWTVGATYLSTSLITFGARGTETTRCYVHKGGIQHFRH